MLERNGQMLGVLWGIPNCRENIFYFKYLNIIKLQIIYKLLV